MGLEPGAATGRLQIKSGIYYSLNAIGAWIWNLIQEPRTVYKVRDVLLKEYEVELDPCERDLLCSKSWQPKGL